MSTTRFSNRSLLVATALCLAALGGAAGCAKRGGALAHAGAIGSAAPEFALPDLNGKVVQKSDFHGKVVILDFWATWCPPCRKEVPEFVRLQSKYREQGLAIVGLSLDESGAREVRPFADENNVNYTMLLAKDETARAFGGIVGIPTTFVLDRKGTIVKRFIGYTEPQVFEEAIRPLLAEPS
jgi:peroxiredoxin